jgi:hypothetical protein
VTGCPACDILIRDTGIPFEVKVNTGVSSPRESGQYRMRARSQQSTCAATYIEIMNSLETLSAEIQCYDTSCPGTRDGLVELYVKGGTEFQFFDQELIQGPDLELYKPLYRFVWTTPEGTRHEPNLQKISEGPVSVRVFDANNCTVEASCEVFPASGPINISLVNSTAPACSSDFGEVVFEVVSGGVAPYTLMKVGPSQTPVDNGDGVILMDTTLVPGVEYFYTVFDANNCQSPLVSFTATPADGFTVNIVTLQEPCTDADFSGTLFADVQPAGTGATFKWFKDNDPNPLPTTTQTLNNVRTGLYAVRVDNLFGCVATDTIGLTGAGDLRLATTRSRTSEFVITETIKGLISGGNGPRYFLEVIPPDTLVVKFDSAGGSNFFEISNVQPTWTGKLRITDRGGCAKEFDERGSRTPITIQPLPPPPDDNITVSEVPKVTHEPIPRAIAWAYFGWLFFSMLGVYMFYELWAGGWYERLREEYVRAFGAEAIDDYEKRRGRLNPDNVPIRRGDHLE